MNTMTFTKITNAVDFARLNLDTRFNKITGAGYIPFHFTGMHSEFMDGDIVYQLCGHTVSEKTALELIETETTKETTEYKHPDSGIVFEVGQVWYDDFNKTVVTITKIKPDAQYPIETTGYSYTKTGRVFEKDSPVGLKILVREPETTKETPEFIHPDCKTVFAVGQVWENGFGVQEKITEILCGHSFPIKTTGGRYTKDGHWHDEGETRFDLKELVEEHKTTKETP